MLPQLQTLTQENITFVTNLRTFILNKDGNLNNDQASQVVQQQVPAGAIVFIRRIDDLARTNNWTDTVTYTNVANSLRVFAQDWLFATVEMLGWEGDQLT